MARVPAWWNLRTILQGSGPGAILARGTGIAFAINAGGALIVFGNQILLARILGPDGYGHYAYVLSWVGVLGVVAVLGQTGTAVRYAAQYHATGRPELLQGFLHWAQHAVGMAAFGLGLLGATIVLILHSRLGNPLSVVFWLGFLLLPVQGLLDLVSASLVGLRQVFAGLFPKYIVRPGLIALLIVGASALSGGTATPQLAMIIHVGAASLALLLARRALWRFVPRLPKRDEQRAEGEWIRVGLPFVLIAGFSITLASTDTIMLGMLRDTREAGIYAVASRAAALVSFMYLAVASIAGPLIVEYHTAGDRHRLRRVLRLGAWVSSGFALLVGAALAFAGRILLSTFGSVFVVATIPMMVLVGGQLVNCLFGLTLTLLVLTGQQARAAAILGVATLVNALANWMLIPRFGMAGAAIATAAVLVLWNGAMAAYVMHLYGINATALSVGSLETK